MVMSGGNSSLVTGRLARLLLMVLTCAMVPQIHGQNGPTSADLRHDIDAASSEVYWLVYSDGALARLGHNHVILAQQLTGTIHLDPQLPQSRFDMEIPVETLLVDDLQMRARLGDGFTSVPSVNDVAGTRRNMLGERVLNADEFPVLRIAGVGPKGEPGSQMMELTVTIAGNTVQLTVPVTVSVQGNTIQASGSFQITHEQLGLRPFSALMGTLKVSDQMEFTYRIVGTRAD